MNTQIFNLKNIGFALLAISAIAMVIMSITGTAISLNMEIASCTTPLEGQSTEGCGIEITEKKISGFFITAIVVGVLGLVSLVIDGIKERKIG